jgi:hypothetical protein
MNTNESFHLIFWPPLRTEMSADEKGGKLHFLFVLQTKIHAGKSGEK